MNYQVEAACVLVEKLVAENAELVEKVKLELGSGAICTEASDIFFGNNYRKSMLPSKPCIMPSMFCR